MGNRWRSQHVRLKYIFMKAHRQEFDMAVMCRLLGVSRSGFYAWLHNPLSDRAVENQRWLGLIRAAYAASHGVYGAPRICLDLREAGETCSKHWVARIMRANNLNALHGDRAPQHVRGHTTSLLTPNTLQRGVTVPRPNAAWVTDITYVRTWEGWLYLAGIKDLFTCEVVGHAMDARMTTDLVCGALRKALTTKRPAPGLLHHSDRGVQYCAHDYQARL